MLNSLNFHHLYYFWTVAHEGSVKAAASKLHLAHATVSGQIKQLESQLGHQLFRRRGRYLELTEVGEVALGYADVIFSAGQELLSSLSRQAPGRPQRLVVGVTEVMPKLVVRQMLEPALRLDGDMRIVCEEDRLERLLAELALHNIDVVLSDTPVPNDVDVKAFNHPLGECELVFCAAPKLMEAKGPGDFPACLEGMPVLMPTVGCSMRRSLDAFFRSHEIRPRIAAEIADSAMLKVLGADGLGVFAVPDVIEEHVCEHYGVLPLGHTTGVRERFYAISTERRIRHPAVLAICNAVRGELFEQG